MLDKKDKKVSKNFPQNFPPKMTKTRNTKKNVVKI